MADLKLSIVIPVYNTKDYIKACLDSVINQNIPQTEYEILLIDDGSTDGSLDMLKEYAALNSNITVFEQKNKGASAARNLGMKNAGGKYIWFIDADDRVAENCLQDLLKIAEQNQLQCLLFGRWDIKDEDRNSDIYKATDKLEIVTDEKEIFTPTTSRYYTGTNVAFMGAVWFMIYELDFLKENNISFNENLTYYEDETFTYICRKNLTKVGYYESPIYFHRRRKNSLSGMSGQNKIKNHQTSLLTTVKVYKEQQNSLKSPYEKEELEYLERKIRDHASLATDLLFCIEDKQFIKQQIPLLYDWKKYIFYNGQEVSAKRKAANIFAKAMPFKLWFWSMWLLHGNKRKENK